MEQVNGFVKNTVTRRYLLRKGATGATALAMAGAAVRTLHVTEPVSAAGNGWAQNTRTPMTTTTAVNFRSEPDFQGVILLVIPAGTTVIAKTVVYNGFRAVTYNRINGWIWAECLV